VEERQFVLLGECPVREGEGEQGDLVHDVGGDAHNGFCVVAVGVDEGACFFVDRSVPGDRVKVDGYESPTALLERSADVSYGGAPRPAGDARRGGEELAKLLRWGEVVVVDAGRMREDLLAFRGVPLLRGR